MSKRKLSEAIVAKLSVPKGEPEIQVHDLVLPGFGVRKYASGKAFYFVKFDVAGQQRKKAWVAQFQECSPRRAGSPRMFSPRPA